MRIFTSGYISYELAHVESQMHVEPETNNLYSIMDTTPINSCGHLCYYGFSSLITNKTVCCACKILMPVDFFCDMCSLREKVVSL